MKLAFWIAAVPALLGSSAAMAGGMAAGLSLGGSVIKMPSGQNGILTLGDVSVSGGSDSFIYAPTIGFNAVVGLGKAGEYDAFAGLNLFATYGWGSANITQNFSGLGTVVIPGVSLPDSGSITLTTTRGSTATATAAITSNPPQGGTFTTAVPNASSGPADGAQSGADVQGDTGNPSFVVGGVNTEVASGVGSALSYGGIADTSGSILIITGDLDGLSISTNTTSRVLYAGGDLTIGVTKQQDEATSLQAYAGPSYRYLGQWSTTNIGAAMTVDIPEAQTPTEHALWIQDTDITTTLASHYFGGVVGVGASRRVSDNMTVAIGAEASAYYLTSHLAGHGSVTTQDGVNQNGDNSPTVTVPLDAVSSFQGNLAYAVRGQVSATMEVAENVGLTFAGSVDYLSKVARPYANANVTGSNGNASWTSGAAGGNSAISFGDMFAFTGTVTLAGHF